MHLLSIPNVELFSILMALYNSISDAYNGDMNVGEKIRVLRKERGLSPERLGMLADVSGQYIRKLELGERESITLAMAEKLARGLGVKPEVFFEGEGVYKPTSPEQALSEIEVSIRAYIPVFGEVSAGEGMEPIDYVAVTRARPAPDTLRAYRVKGLCLEPEIRDGDTVIVDTARPPEPGDIVVVIIDNQASVKRYKTNGSGPYLENGYGTYRPDQVHMHGVVVELNRKMK